MRRFLAVSAVPLLAGLALAGCGSAKAPASGPSPNLSVSATGAFGTTPSVSIPASKAGPDLVVRTLVSGTGAPVTATDAVLSQYVIYTWDGTKHKLVASTYTGQPYLFPQVPTLSGLQKALVGAKAGSRVLAVVPPKFAFGSSGNPSAGVSGTTTLVFVFDLLGAYSPSAGATGTAIAHGGGALPTVTAPTAAGTAPAVTIPKSAPPSTLREQTLIKGTGRAVSKGDYVVTQYVGYLWRNGKVFDSSWSRKIPFVFQADASPEQIIKGWDLGLTGQTVGSRVLLVIPPADGYGKTGSSQAGITGTDTLVFVVDIVDAVPKAA